MVRDLFISSDASYFRLIFSSYINHITAGCTETIRLELGLGSD